LYIQFDWSKNWLTIILAVEMWTCNANKVSIFYLFSYLLIFSGLDVDTIIASKNDQFFKPTTHHFPQISSRFIRENKLRSSYVYANNLAKGNADGI